MRWYDLLAADETPRGRVFTHTAELAAAERKADWLSR